MLRDAGLDGIEVDSAGTGPWHVGDDMDHRARAALVANGYTPHRHVGKQFSEADFATRDLVVALDRGHEARLSLLAGMTDDPDDARAKIVLLRSYDPAADGPDVPDPYSGNREDFAVALDQIERACAGLLAAVRAPSPRR